MSKNAQDILTLIQTTIAEQGNPDGVPVSKLGITRYSGQAVMSPAQYKKKFGEAVDPSVVAIILHKGPGAMSTFFSLDACAPGGWGAASDYSNYESMCGSNGALAAKGFRAEQVNAYTSYVISK